MMNQRNNATISANSNKNYVNNNRELETSRPVVAVIFNTIKKIRKELPKLIVLAILVSTVSSVFSSVSFISKEVEVLLKSEIVAEYVMSMMNSTNISSSSSLDVVAGSFSQHKEEDENYPINVTNISRLSSSISNNSGGAAVANMSQEQLLKESARVRAVVTKDAASSKASVRQDERHRNDDLSATGLQVPAWKNSTVFPKWMKYYIEWHREARHNITTGKQDWKDYKYLVVRCGNAYRCGGTADRLKPLPYYMLTGYQLKRLLFIDWERPAKLEEFLVPPKHGFNWSWPPHENLTNYKFGPHPDVSSFRKMSWHMTNDGRGLRQITTTKLQSYSHGEGHYNVARERVLNRTSSHELAGGTYGQLFKELWETAFVPSPPVARIIEDRMREMNLQTDKYNAVHIRSNYRSDLPNAQQIRKNTINAVNCMANLVVSKYHKENNIVNTHNQSSSSSSAASHEVLQQIVQGTALFVASDNKKAARAAVRYAREDRQIAQVKSLVNEAVDNNTVDEPTLHVELSRNVSEIPRFYDTFVDLYILSRAKCIAYGKGNYGKWANLMSSDPSCQTSHVKTVCSWLATKKRAEH